MKVKDMFFFKFFFCVLIFGVSFNSAATPVSPSKPFSFTQEKNWCWMASALQCLYALKDFRAALQVIITQNIPSNSEKYEAWLFFKKLNTAFDAITLKQHAFTDLYDYIYKSKTTPLFLQSILKKWEQKVKEEEKENKKLFEQYTQESQLYEEETNRLSQIENYDGPWLKDPTMKVKVYIKRKLEAYQDAENAVKNIYGKFSNPLVFIAYLSAALKQFEHLQSISGLMRWTTTDRSEYVEIAGEPQTLQEFINKKKDCKILVIHIAPLAKAPAETIQSNGNLYNLVGVCVGSGAHFTALVRYGEIWVEFDTLGKMDGTPRGKNYEQALAATGKTPNDFFYQKADVLSDQLLKLTQKLELLKSKLSSLYQALDNLRAQL